METETKSSVNCEEDTPLDEQATTIIIDVGDLEKERFADENDACKMSIFIDSYNSELDKDLEYENYEELKSIIAEHENYKKHEEQLVISEINFTQTSQTCTLCSCVFENPASLTDHIRQVHSASDGDSVYKCPFCVHTTNSKQSIDVHLRVHTLEKPFKCAVCGKAFNQKGGVQQHMRTHSKIKPFSCHICQGRYKTASTLSAHINMTHAQLKPFSCMVCNMSFGHSSNLRIHMRTHTGERPYKCNVCAKSFVQQGHLKAHSRLHTGERPFGCSYCDASFTHVGNLRQHEITQHTKDYKHRCMECKKGFIGPGDLKRHMTSNHSPLETAAKVLKPISQSS